MDLAIVPLSPDLAEDYVRFFDVTPHWDGKPEETCYCVSWRGDQTYTRDGDHWFATREERRSRALEYVKGGHLRGYLAYTGGRIVGWCNATGDCRGGVGYLRGFWPVPPDAPGERVKSVFCFAIAPDFRRRGVATRLLERVCQDAAGEGFGFVEAYAATGAFDAVHGCQGALAMYEKCGFVRTAEKDGKVVVRRALLK